MEETIVEQRCGDAQMIGVQPDWYILMNRSKVLLGCYSCRDIERIRRFILRKCSEGGHLTPDQFKLYYSQVEFLNIFKLISTTFRYDGSEKIHVTKDGLAYLNLLDDVLGAETNCKEDGEPVMKAFPWLSKTPES